MGLKTTNYEVKDLGVTLPTAYAQITSIISDRKGNACAQFAVQQSRDDIEVKNDIERLSISYMVDKSKPLYEQLYDVAKKTIFDGWEDDIVEETQAVEESIE